MKLRSLLFVPADSERKLAKSLDIEPDAFGRLRLLEKDPARREPAAPHLSSSRRVYLNIVLIACQNDRPSRC